MGVSFMGFAIVGLALVVVVAALALWRRMVAVHEDDTLHVAAGSGVVAQQTHVAHQLDVIDRWGKILTIIAAVYLICLCGVYLYYQWVERAVIPR